MTGHVAAEGNAESADDAVRRCLDVGILPTIDSEDLVEPVHHASSVHVGQGQPALLVLSLCPDSPVDLISRQRSCQLAPRNLDRISDNTHLISPIS